MDKLHENKENVTCGCLKFNNKLFPIHEGLNPIGRNPDAVVCLKNLNVSKHHAIITILNGESHYISDYKSFNGTILDGKKLVPLQLYELQNGASIKFGDVFCTYKKLQGEKIDKADETQQFSETFFNTNTQQVATTNVPEGISIGEMVTQVFAPKELQVNELPTQLFHYSDQDHSSNDSVDFATMQKASNTQKLNGEKPSSSKDCGLNEDLGPTATSTQKTNETDASEIRPVVLHGKKIIDSESEEETSQVHPVPGKKKNIIDSDSSDTEDDLQDGSKYHISDSETDVEEKENEKSIMDTSTLSQLVEIPNEEAPIVEKVKRKSLPQDHLYCQAVANTQELSQHVETSTEPPISNNQTVENDKNDSFNEVDKEFEFDVDLEESKVPESSKVVENEETPDITSEIEAAQTKDQTKSISSEKEIDIYLQPTQTMNYTHNDKPKDEFLLPTQPLKPQNKEPGPSTAKDVFDDDFFVPTQAIEKVTKTVKVDDYFEPTQPEKDQENDFLQPTQALENLHGAGEPLKILDDELTTQNLHDIFSDDSINVSPSETRDRVWSETKIESPAKKDFLSPPKEFKSPLARKKPVEEDSFIIQPTQALEAMHEPEKHFHQVEDQLHEIFASQSLLCTQQLVDVLNISRDDVIEDSLIQETSISKTKKEGKETVVDILAEGLDGDKTLEKSNLEDDAKKDERLKPSTSGTKNQTEKRKETEENNKLEASTSRSKSRTSKRKESNEAKEVSQKNKSSISTEASNKDETEEHGNKNSNKKEEELKLSTSRSKSRTRKRKEETEEVQKGSHKNNTDEILSEVLDKNEAKDPDDEDQKELKPTTSRTKSRTRRRNDESEEVNEAQMKNNANKADLPKEAAEKKETQKPSVRESRSSKKNNNLEEAKVKESKEINETPSIPKHAIEGTPNRRGRPKKTLQETPPVQVEENQGDGPQVKSTNKSAKGKKQSQNSNVKEETDDTTKRRGRSRTTPASESDSRPKITRSVHICADNDIEVTTNKEKTKANKRKNEETVVEIPNKKSLIASTPKKRALRAVSNNSEDDFEVKVPKTENRASLRSRKSKTVTEDSDVISVSSSKTSQSVISISSTPGSTGEETGKRTRRLSANSKRQLREEEAERKSRNSSMSIASSSFSSLSTPDRQKRMVKPKVVFTMMDSPELESVIRQLGGSIVDNVHACSVLVTESVKRSQKLLVAIAQGKPICSPQWLQSCKKSYSFVDPWDHILVDKEAEKKWKFSLRESIKRGASRKLLENYTFQIIVNNAADVLKGAIEACGGKCVTRNLPKCQTEHLIIVSINENRSKFSKILKQNSKILVVEPEAIFDGTLRQEFHFSKHQV